MSNITGVVMMSKYNPYDHDYRFSKQLLIRIGLWPSQDRHQRLILTAFFNFIILMIFVVEIHQLTLPSFNIRSNIKELQIFLLFLCCTLCYYSVVFNRDALEKLCEHIVTDWQQMSCDAEVGIMKKYAKESEQFTICITIILHLFGIFLIIPSLLKICLYVFHVKDEVDLTLPIPLKSLPFFDDHFYVTLSLEIVAVWTIITVAIVLYTSFLLAIKHSCSLLQVITFKIDQPFGKISDNMPHEWLNTRHRNSYEWIKEIAKRHQNATEYVALINTLTEKLYIIEMFVSTLILVINFLDFLQSYEMVLSKSGEYIFELIISGIYTGGSIVIIYMNCYIGQTLIDHGTDVLESFYQVPLYKLPLKCQRLLAMMILRTTKPSMISIGGMFAASHDFFAGVINTSVSYAMVCYNIR